MWKAVSRRSSHLIEEFGGVVVLVGVGGAPHTRVGLQAPALRHASEAGAEGGCGRRALTMPTARAHEDSDAFCPGRRQIPTSFEGKEAGTGGTAAEMRQFVVSSTGL
eukprot:4314950-Pleurochrysis_carterae.AAC.3